MLKHIIFTNFGVGITDELWLTYRLEILQHTVAVSLAAQTNPNFEWHVFIDQRLPNLHRMRLEGLKDLVRGLVLHEVDDYARIIITAHRIARSTPCEVLVTSRIDDDDCLHVSAVHRIQQAALADVGSDRACVIALQNGLEYLPTDGVVRPVQHELLALGLSLVDRCPGDAPLVVSSYACQTICETLSDQNISANYIGVTDSEPLYLYTRHQLSDSNYFGARARILKDTARFEMSDDVSRQFGLDRRKVESLKRAMLHAPVGMPYKCLEQLALVRQALREATHGLRHEQGPASAGETDIDMLRARQRRLERQATRRNPAARGKAKVRVAILGSCVTRDLFERQKTHLGSFEVCFYSARSSLASAQSLPNTDSRLSIPQDSFENKRARYDLDKSLWDRLEASRPDIVITDLIDERLGLILHQGSVFSASGPMIKAFERAGVEHAVVRPWNETAVALRRWAAKPFLERIHGICSSVFLHRAQWADSYLDKDQNIQSFADSPFAKLIELNNQIMRAAFSALETACVPFESIGGPEPGHMLAGGQHLWDFAPYHYDERYYRALARQLVAHIT